MGRIMLRIYTKENFSRVFDHTGLDNDKALDYFERLCLEAKEYKFKMVAINSSQTKLCADILKDTDIGVGAAISFPLGQTTVDTKVYETEEAIQNGATEIDYVVNIVEVKDNNWDYVKEEMQRIVEVCRKENVISKVIFENALLKNKEIIQLAKIAKIVQPDFVKTSTGKAKSGAKVEDIKLMKKHIGTEVKIKAAGGIRTFEAVLKMLEAGAERIGASQSIQIVNEFEAHLAENNISKIVIQ